MPLDGQRRPAVLSPTEKARQMPKSTIHRPLSVFGAVALLAVAACGSDHGLGPDNQLEVTNRTDTFEWQATAMDKISQTLTYDWETTGTTADVNQSSSLTGGSATVTISDDGGRQVYARDLGESGTFTTIAGTAGTWKVRVKLSRASGAVNFRVDRP
jgi:hypothetical protein